MAFADDIASDGLIWDGGATVTLIQKRGGGATKLTIRNATNSPLSYSQTMALGGVAMPHGGKSWSLNATDVGSNGVLIGDLIDDGTNTWFVLAVDHRTLSNRWKTATRLQEPQT